MSSSVSRPFVFRARPAVVKPGERDGERFYKISDYHSMRPFLMSVVSGYDHWLFVSSTGGLTCGRREPANALFPYCTDDKIHDARETTGPKTALRVARGGRTLLWQPFEAGPFVYNLQRNLYKNVPGNKLVFEEVNHDLGLAFTYTWTTGNRFWIHQKIAVAQHRRERGSGGATGRVAEPASPTASSPPPRPS